jgi:FHA domain
VDVLDAAILGLRLALVAVLYAFLLLVVRSGWRRLQAAPPPLASTLAGLRLVVVDPGGSGFASGQVIDVFDGARLGRAAPAEIVVADRSISATHVRFARHGRRQTWTVTDLGSTNGTLLNDARVDGPTPLVDGDVLVLGGVRFTVGAR